MMQRTNGPTGANVEVFTAAGPLGEDFQLVQAEVAVDERRCHVVAVDRGPHGLVLQYLELCRLLKLPLVAHAITELLLVELLQFCLLEVTAADAAGVELDADGRPVLTHHPGCAHT